MADIKCPNCRSTLPTMELAQGWCDSCGNKIPLYIYEEGNLESPDEIDRCRLNHEAPANLSIQDAEKPAYWQMGLVLAGGLGLAVLIALTLS